MAQYYAPVDKETKDAKLLSGLITTNENDLSGHLGKYTRLLNGIAKYYPEEHPVYALCTAMVRLMENPYTPICVDESMEDCTIALYGNEKLPDAMPSIWTPVIPVTL